jgi:mRNA interferase YafQ
VANKRAAHPRGAEFSRNFSKDWERLSRSGRYNMHQLKEAILLLIANDGPLGPEWKDHPLKGDWVGYRECHIGGDFLLIYRLENDNARSETVYFARIGTHSELFEN